MMDKKMTSGEIAKKAGVSQKAIRLYDEKGLLKPSDYSEGNYRLYDKEALQVLEKIIALKQIGYSLEEIYENLIAKSNQDVIGSLKNQLELMEAKKAELEQSIACIKSVLVRSEEKGDWNSVAEIAHTIQEDQGADERHFHALKHTADNVDWYVKIYNSLNIEGDTNVLDIGCGFGKVWRNNWMDIPANINVVAVDIHGSWADNFNEFIETHESSLAEGTHVNFLWGDITTDEIWNGIAGQGPYNTVLAHYLLSFIKDEENLIKHVSEHITSDGMFSCNGHSVSTEHLFWNSILDEAMVDSSFITRKIKEEEKSRDAFKEMLCKYFIEIDISILENRMRYDNSEELFNRLLEQYPENKKYIVDRKSKIIACLEQKISENSYVIIETEGQFWHCYKPICKL